MTVEILNKIKKNSARKINFSVNSLKFQNWYLTENYCEIQIPKIFLLKFMEKYTAYVYISIVQR